MDELDSNFETQRAIYLKNLAEGVFPWQPAYYYYCLHIDRIDIMSFAEFKETIQLKSMEAENKEDVSGPIYAALDEYYEPMMLFSEDNTLLKLY